MSGGIVAVSMDSQSLCLMKWVWNPFFLQPFPLSRNPVGTIVTNSLINWLYVYLLVSKSILYFCIRDKKEKKEKKRKPRKPKLII